MEVTVSSKGQIVIPQEIRERLKIKEGQTIRVEEVSGTIIIVPVPKDPVKALKGIAGKLEQDSTKIVRSLRKEWDE